MRSIICDEMRIYKAEIDLCTIVEVSSYKAIATDNPSMICDSSVLGSMTLSKIVNDDLRWFAMFCDLSWKWEKRRNFGDYRKLTMSIDGSWKWNKLSNAPCQTRTTSSRDHLPLPSPTVLLTCMHARKWRVNVSLFNSALSESTRSLRQQTTSTLPTTEWSDTFWGCSTSSCIHRWISMGSMMIDDDR